MRNNNSFFYKAKADFAQEAIDLFARMTVQPTQKQKLVINDTIKALKNAEIWDLLDVLIMLYSHNVQAAYLNWKNNFFNATPTNAPSFTPFSGVYSDIGKSINLNFIPSSALGNYKLNNASAGVFTNTESQNNLVDLGRSYDINRLSIYVRTLNNDMQGLINNELATRLLTPTTEAVGFTCANLYNNEISLIKNGNVIASKTYTPTALPTINMLLGNSIPRNYKVAFIGGSLTAYQHIQLHLIINNYLTNYTNA